MDRRGSLFIHASDRNAGLARFMNDENVKPNVVAKPFRDHKSLLKLSFDFF